MSPSSPADGIERHSLITIFSLPGGQKARVVFAELACREPDVLILVSSPRSSPSPQGEGQGFGDYIYPRCLVFELPNLSWATSLPWLLNFWTDMCHPPLPNSQSCPSQDSCER